MKSIKSLVAVSALALGGALAAGGALAQDEAASDASDEIADEAASAIADVPPIEAPADVTDVTAEATVAPEASAAPEESVSQAAPAAAPVPRPAPKQAVKTPEAGVDVAQSGSGEAMAATAAEGKTAYDFISDGGRVEVKDKEFSMNAPMGWEVFTTHPNLTLLMQVPHEKGMKYQRTIQVASFGGPRYMDEVTAKEFEDLIVKKFSNLTSSIENYRMRNRLPIEMADGRTGMLFYSEFSMYDTPLMQAHVLVSSPNRHFLLTYTDLAEHFEKEEKSQYLTEAWEALTSAQLEGQSPSRFETMMNLGLVAGVLIVLALSIWGIRSWLAGRQYRQFEGGGGSGGDEGDGDDKSGAPVSLLGDDDDNLSAAPATGEDDALRRNSKKLPAKTGKAKDRTMPPPPKVVPQQQRYGDMIPTPSRMEPQPVVPPPPKGEYVSSFSKFGEDDEDVAV